MSNKAIKKWIVTILGILMLILAIPTCASAATGSNAKGAKLPKYERVETITVDKDNFFRSLYSALMEADTQASSKCQYKIIIPPGSYTLPHLLRVRSNTWIYAKGAKITMDNYTTRLFTTEPNKSYENIKIEGGIWDASKQPVGSGKSDIMLRFAHVKNLILTDLTVKCNRNNHIIEVSDMNGFTVSKCKISGNDQYLQTQPKEAFQLDVATQAAMVNCTPYNGKGCHNVLITGNTFTNVSRGVGSHSYAEGAEKNPYTDITVEKNTFKNSKGEAIHILYWKNCSIRNNKISNAKYAGIYVESSESNDITGNKISKVGAYSGERRRTYGDDHVGILLRNANNNRVTGNTASGCTDVVLTSLVCNGNVIKNNKKK